MALEAVRSYMAQMPSGPEIKRLAWRAHHRGTKEADMLVGGFFDAHHHAWGAKECVLFEAMLEEQDVDIMAWAHGTSAPPERFVGPLMNALTTLDYIKVQK